MKKLVTFLSLIFIFLVGNLLFFSPAFANSDYLSDGGINFEKVELETIFNDIDNGVVQPYDLTSEHHFLSCNNIKEKNRFSGNDNDLNISFSFSQIEKQADFKKKNYFDIEKKSQEWLFASSAKPRAP